MLPVGLDFHFISFKKINQSDIHFGFCEISIYIFLKMAKYLSPEPVIE